MWSLVFSDVPFAARLHGAPLQIRGWPTGKAAELRWGSFRVVQLRREGRGFDLGDAKLQVTCHAMDTLEAGELWG